jgi:hypothetical protein
MAEADDYERGLRRKTARNRLISSALVLLVVVPLVGFRLYRLVNTLDRPSPTQRSSGLLSWSQRNLFNSLGTPGMEFIKQVDILESIAAMYGSERIPAESWLRVQGAFEGAKRAAASADLDEEQRNELAAVERLVGLAP